MKKLLLAFILPLFCFTASAGISKSQIADALVSKGVLLQKTPYIITSQYTSANNGVTHVYLRQTLNGIEVFNANSSLNFDKNDALINFNNGFITVDPTTVAELKNGISYATAINKVAAQLNIKVNIVLAKLSNNAREFIVHDPQASAQDVKAKIYYLYKNKQFIAVWNIEIYDNKKGDWWNKRVDVQNGEIIDENNWTTHCNTSQVKHAVKKNDYYSFSFDDEVLLKKAATGSYRVIPFPFESPQKSNPVLINSQATATASPYGWHDVDGIAGSEYTITRGNNVYAKEDTLARDSSGYAPDGGSALIFDFPFDSVAYPRSYLKSAITNLFYWNNIVHDIFYRYGFDEASGNFQQYNYTQAGIGEDYVLADAQDGSGTNNANFSTPPEGNNPRMQMFIWEAASNSNIFNINTPAYLKGQYLAAVASFGPYPAPPGVTGNLALTNDGTSQPTYACSTIVNNVAGKIALIDRGNCYFVDKVYNAQLAGAKAVVIINNTPGAPFSMGTAGTKDKLINIPSVMINQALGNSLKSLLASDSVVNITLVDSAGGPKYFDSDFDNGVIIHESAHGVSNRLTGGPFNTNCLYNAEQGGEGWSDFFALALTARASDNPAFGKGIGTYLIAEDTTGLGIRDYKYSRNMTVNPATYDYIKTNAEVHFVGFVWCTMLYDIFWDMADKYGFNNDIYNGTGGNNKAIQLVMDGLKLQPCMPGFVDARNAILLADSINNNFANRNLLWKAFARRGLGFYASQGSADIVTDGTQSFSLPPLTTVVNSQPSPSDISVFPNPTTGIINIQLNTTAQFNQITLYDLTGKIIMQKACNNTNTGIALDLSNAAKGIYFLQLTSNSGAVCKKVIVE
ncbi:MAG: T9SS-dependent M36 family metallopeptidase [Bacteroidia bacterium]|nr:T9SS-dependent M36 family metallopeptidase [Bacteroidia bacterium]